MNQIKDFYIDHLNSCFDKAELGDSKISASILEMEGMTGKKTRHFYNNLLNIPDSRYLEIGTWAGSSVCAAMYNNKSKILCIDNWSLFDGHIAKEKFQLSFNEFKGDNDAVFIEADCFKLDVSSLGKFNIYLYDGGHSYEEHFKAISYYLECLDDVFILVIDDWNWFPVRIGTFDGMISSELTVLWVKEIRLTKNDDHTPHDIARETWWNGICVFLLEKKHNP